MTDRYINRERFFGIFFFMTFRHIFSGEFWLTAILYSGQRRLAAILRAASQTSNLKISANSKPNSKIFWDMYQGHRWVRFMKKSRCQKSRATVLLSKNIVDANDFRLCCALVAMVRVFKYFFNRSLQRFKLTPPPQCLALMMCTAGADISHRDAFFLWPVSCTNSNYVLYTTELPYQAVQ